jgi:hypothetical protein
MNDELFQAQIVDPTFPVISDPVGGGGGGVSGSDVNTKQSISATFSGEILVSNQGRVRPYVPDPVDP